jgi:hypothetical protein
LTSGFTVGAKLAAPEVGLHVMAAIHDMRIVSMKAFEHRYLLDLGRNKGRREPFM